MPSVRNPKEPLRRGRSDPLRPRLCCDPTDRHIEDRGQTRPGPTHPTLQRAPAPAQAPAPTPPIKKKGGGTGAAPLMDRQLYWVMGMSRPSEELNPNGDGVHCTAIHAQIAWPK